MPRPAGGCQHSPGSRPGVREKRGKRRRVGHRDERQGRWITWASGAAVRLEVVIPEDAGTSQTAPGASERSSLSQKRQQTGLQSRTQADLLTH